MLRSGFSLVEMVIVAAIIAVLAAIAIPRFSRGAEGARETSLRDNLATMHKAVELYAIEHCGRYPDADRVEQQLTLYTDQFGNPSAVRGAPYVYGPYLQAIPPVPVGPRQGARGIAEAPGAGIGWIYDPARGRFAPHVGP